MMISPYEVKRAAGLVCLFYETHWAAAAELMIH